MGNIIIANLTASLTLDTHQFDDASDRAQARLQDIAAQAKELGSTGATPPGGGQKDPEVAAAQERSMARAQEVAQANDAHARMQASASAAGEAQTRAFERGRQAFDTYVQTQIKGLAQVQSLLDGIAASYERLGRAQVPSVAEAAPSGGGAVAAMERAGGGMSEAGARGATIASIALAAVTGEGIAGQTVEATKEARRKRQEAAAPALAATRPHAVTLPEPVDVDPDAAIEKEMARKSEEALRKAREAVAPPSPMSEAERASAYAKYEATMQALRSRNGATSAGAGQELSTVGGGSVAEQLKSAGVEDIGPSGAVLDQLLANGITPDMLSNAKMSGGVLRIAEPSAAAKKRAAAAAAAASKAGEPEGDALNDAMSRAGLRADESGAVEEQPGEEGEGPAGRIGRMPSERPSERVKNKTFWFPGLVAERGREESLSYQRYQVLESPTFGLAERALGPSAPGIGNLLTAVAGPELAAAAAATALGEALKEATDAAKAYSVAQFQLNEQNRTTPLGTASGAEALSAQSARMRSLGFGGLQEEGALADLTRYTSDPKEIQRVQGLSADMARAFGLSLQQSQGMFEAASQGDTGAFHQYFPQQINQGDTFGYVQQVVQQRVGGAAERYVGTPAGGQAQFEADWEELMTKIGQAFLPTVTTLTKAAEDAMPVVEGVAKGIGLVVDAFGALAHVVGIVLSPLDALTKMIPGAGSFWDKVGKGLAEVEQKSADFLAWADSKTNPTILTAATGYRQNGQGEWGADNGGKDVPTYEQQLRNLAALNPQVAGQDAQGAAAKLSFSGLSMSGGSAAKPVQGPVGPGQYEAAYQKFKQMYPNSQALAAGVTGGAFDESGKYIGAGGGASNLGGGQLADTSQAQVSSMRLIQEETSDTLQAVTGVSDIYAKLTNFHVDFSTVKGNLGNLQEGILYLQQFWVQTANSMDTGITTHQYDVTKTWLDMVNTMLSVMQNATGALAEVYKTSGEMPSQAQMQAIVSRLDTMFKETDKVAKVVMSGSSVGEQTKQMALLQGWAAGMGQLVSLIGSGADVLAKIDVLPMPDQSQIQGTADKIVAMIQGMDDALTKAFVKAQDQHEGATLGIDSSLANAAVMAQNADALVTLASGGADLFEKMRGLYVPSDGDIETVVDRVMSVADKVAAAIKARMQKEASTQPPDPSSIAQQHGVFGALMTDVKRGAAQLASANAPSIDPALQAAGAVAENESKLLAVVGGGIQDFTNMRGMHIPAPSDIDATTNAINEMVQSMAKFGQDPSQLVKAATWTKDAQTIVDAVGAGVQVFVNMRGMHVPGRAAIDETTDGIQQMVNDLAARLPKNSDTMLIQAGKWAGDAGQIVTVISAGVQVFQGMRFMHVPATEAINAFLRGLDELITAFMPITAKYSDPMLVKAKEWSDTMGPLVSVLSSGVGVLKGIRELLPPGKEQMAEFRTDLGIIIDEFMSATTEWKYTALDAAKQWADDMGPFVQTLASGADLLQKVRDLRVPSQQAIADFVAAFHTIAEDMLAQALKDGYIATDRAKEWGDAMSSVMQAATEGEQLLLGLRDLHEPSRAAVDDFISTVDYMSGKFLLLAEKYSPDMEGAMTGYGQTVQTVMAGLTASETLMQKLPSTAVLPKTMIDGFFDNLDGIVTDFRDRAATWKKRMDLENSNLAVDLGTEMDGLLKASQFFNSLGGFRVDYRGQVNMFFANLDHAVEEFSAGAEQWKGQMDENTHRLSGYMTDEFTAINAAIDPMTKIEQASHAQPGMIDMVFGNLRVMVSQFAQLADSPELKGTKLASLQQFSAQMNDVFGAIKNATDAASALNTPAGQLGGGDFTSVMESFFMRSVPTYAREWDVQMQAMAGSAEKMSGRVVTALGNTGIAPRVSAAVGAASVQPASAQQLSRGASYQNCIFLNDVEVGQGADAKQILKALTDWSNKQNGGVPVNAAPVK